MVGSESKGLALAAHLQAFHASGNALTNGTEAMLPVGQSLTYDFALQPFYLTRAGDITILVTVKDAPDAQFNAVAQPYPGAWRIFRLDVTNLIPDVCDGAPDKP